MSQASKVLNPINYFINIVNIHHSQWGALFREGINNVEDLAEFDDDDIDNIVTNLWRPQDIFHTEVPAQACSPEVVAVPAAIGVVEVLHVPAVPGHAQIDARSKK